jgi:DNA-binding transcriptional MerR regulator
MAVYRISELAQRSGFSPTTLRYYETVGVVPPPARSSAGYRIYDEDALDRLAFVRRAKALGLALDDIVELVQIRDDRACASLQQRIGTLLDERLAAIRHERDELAALGGQLGEVRDRLAMNDPPEQCATACGCDEELEPGAVATPVPVACTLDERQADARLDEWRALVSEATTRVSTEDGARLGFPPDPALVARVAELAARETHCCAFLAFTLRCEVDTAWLEVHAPPDAQALVSGLFLSIPPTA